MPLELVVLLISESDLRSALTARLTMLGFNVVTLGPGQMPEDLPSATIAAGVLVTDAEAAAQSAGDAQAWLQVIVLDESASASDGRPIRLPRRGATRHVVEVLARWRDARPPE